MNTPQSTKKTKVELEHLFETAWQDGMGCANNPNYKKRTQLLTQKALTILKETCEAVIGEDEPEKTMAWRRTGAKYNGPNPQTIARNTLRAEQRKTLNNLLGGDDNDLL